MFFVIFYFEVCEFRILVIFDILLLFNWEFLVMMILYELFLELIIMCISMGMCGWFNWYSLWCFLVRGLNKINLLEFVLIFVYIIFVVLYIECVLNKFMFSGGSILNGGSFDYVFVIRLCLWYCYMLFFIEKWSVVSLVFCGWSFFFKWWKLLLFMRVLNFLDCVFVWNNVLYLSFVKMSFMMLLMNLLVFVIWLL